MNLIGLKQAVHYTVFSVTQQRWTLLATILASGVVQLDGSIINVALSSIDRDLSAGLAGLQWIVAGYALTLASFMILGGALSDRYGRKRSTKNGP